MRIYFYAWLLFQIICVSVIVMYRQEGVNVSKQQIIGIILNGLINLPIYICAYQKIFNF